MVVQNQSQLGNGSAIPTDLHHTHTFIQPSTQHQKTQQTRKPKRKDTQVPQPSDPIKNVADEAVHKELGDSLVRAVTTASSLEAEQDSSNINNTQSKATPNESSSQGTNSGGGPRCQETIGDTIARTMFESVSKHSNDSLLARGNTLRSDEDRLKLDELMALYEAVHKELGDSLVRDATTASSLEAEQDSGGGPRCQETIEDTIARTRFDSVSKHSNDSLLARGNTLQSDEDRLKLDELMALFGLTTRVESYDNEESLGEDASKQGRIDAIDADEDITLVSVVDHDVNVSADEEVFVGEQEVVRVINTAKLIIDAAQDSAATTVSTATTTTAILKTVDDITLAQALEEMKTTKPKKKGVVI
ncbi:hypothetical protein Tco_0242331 [Tanacetum coccineum]